jgi:energy-coupling factor transporter ATP-binding protein EcfA2
MLWIHGPAGSGKSTLATTIANIFRDYVQLGTFLFFDRDVMERSDPTTVIRTLAHQLCTSDLRIGAAIRTTIEGNPNMLMSPLYRQFQKLILEPISQSQPLSSTIVIVIDAFDECGTAEDREALLTVLAQDFSNLPISTRTIITSRPQNDICNAFESQSHILAYELDITSLNNSDDILSYFRHSMLVLHEKNKYLSLRPDWPREEVLRLLVERAAGLFCGHLLR